jgi:hypothetical protein
MMLRPRSAWAADAMDLRVAGIVAKTIGIDTHNHVDVPLTVAEMPGPDIDLKGEMKRSGLSAICMTFATDYQPGDAYDRFLKGLASMDGQLERNGMQRSLTPADIRARAIRMASQPSSRRSKAPISCKAMWSESKRRINADCGSLGCFTTAMPLFHWAMFTPILRAMAD